MEVIAEEVVNGECSAFLVRRDTKGGSLHIQRYHTLATVARFLGVDPDDLLKLRSE